MSAGRVRRVLCLDVGEKRIGVAVSDPLGLTAQGVETIHTRGEQRDRERVCELLRQYETDVILSGLPKNLDGSEGFQAQRVRAFVEPFREMGYTVLFQDERMTTMSAHRALLEADVSRARRKQVVDKLAATYILQSFLDGGGLKRLLSPEQRKVKLSEVYRPMDGYMEQDNIVELVDDEGNTVEFEHIMTVEHAGKEFVLLVPVTEMEDVEDDEMIVLQIATDDEGNDVYVGVEDEELLEQVFNKYLEIVENEDEE